MQLITVTGVMKWPMFNIRKKKKKLSVGAHNNYSKEKSHEIWGNVLQIVYTNINLQIEFGVRNWMWKSF